MEGDDSLWVEKEKEEEAKRTQKKAKPAAKPRATPAPNEPTTSVAEAESPGKRSKKAIKERTKARTVDNFLRNEPSPGAAIRDVIGTISGCVIPRDTGKVITKLLSDRWPRGGGRDVVAARARPGGGGGNSRAPGHGNAAAHEVAKQQHHKLRGEGHDTVAARARRGQGARVQLTLNRITANGVYLRHRSAVSLIPEAGLRSVLIKGAILDRFLAFSTGANSSNPVNGQTPRGGRLRISSMRRCKRSG